MMTLEGKKKSTRTRSQVKCVGSSHRLGWSSSCRHRKDGKKREPEFRGKPETGGAVCARRSKTVTARSGPGCNTRGRMILLSNILSFRTSVQGWRESTERASQGSGQSHMEIPWGAVSRWFKFRELLGERALAGDTDLSVRS